MLNYIAAVALFVAPAIAVPWTNATCVDHAWSFNSRGQSPCWVASSIASSCTTDNSFKVPALEVGGYYSFDVSQANTCVCNSVMWNILSACALCQMGISTSWTQWVSSCPSSLINVGKYPLPLPGGVTVPSWAYYDFTVADTFNPVIASQQVGLESSAVSGATSTPAPVPNPTVAPASTVTGANGSAPTPKPITSQSSSGSNTGAIVGGIVGGVLGIGLIGLIAFVLTRKRKTEEPANKYPEANHKPPMSTAFNATTPMAGHVPSHQFGAPNQPVSTPDHKPYDPSDPSTFPTATATPDNGHYVESLPYPYQPQGTPGPPPYPSVPQV
ncbi:hypothetical protein B0J17DRAFT_202420 [Rhizoctonia solani]|nr:hypothetical protein B0J17DRAFT_202420 [Rhizoctonia solani]